MSERVRGEVRDTRQIAPVTLIRRRTYSVPEAAAILGISRAKAYECVRSGELPALRFGRRIVVPASVVDDLLGESSIDQVAESRGYLRVGSMNDVRVGAERQGRVRMAEAAGNSSDVVSGGDRHRR